MSLFLLGLSTQFKNWYIGWSLHYQHKLTQTQQGSVLLLHSLGMLFRSDGKMEWEMDKWIRVSSAVIRLQDFDEISVLPKVTGLTLIDKLRSLRRAAASLHWMSQLRWFVHLIPIPAGFLTLEVVQHIQLGADPQHTDKIIYPLWPGNTSGLPKRNWRIDVWVLPPWHDLG